MTIKDGIKLGIGLVIGRNVCTIISDTLAKCIAKTDIYKNYIHKTDGQNVIRLIFDINKLKDGWESATFNGLVHRMMDMGIITHYSDTSRKESL